MTAICYRDGIFAADTAVMASGIRVGNVKKIIRATDGTLCSFAGDTGPQTELAKWLEEGRATGQRFDPKSGEGGSFGAIIVQPDGIVWRMDHNGHLFIIEAEWHTEGACIEIMTGALAMGATAVEAVTIACKYSKYAGGPVQVVALNGDAG